MIDFRYHLASLMAVLIALTMGVILGAGPLQEPLSRGLAGELNSITKEKADLKNQLSQADSQAGQRDTYITELTNVVAAGSLKGNNIALIEMPGAPAADVENISKALTGAGAVITDRVKLTSAWTNQANTAYREQLSQSLTQYLTNPAPATAVAEQILGQGMLQVLSSSDAKATSIFELLTAKDLPLMQLPVFSKGKANAYVVVGAMAPVAAAEGQDPAPKDASTMIVKEAVIGFMQAFTTVPKRAVAVGDGTYPDGILTLARSNSLKVTTVDSLGTVMATQSVPLALAAAENGTIANYGQETGADKVVPPLPVKETKPADAK